MKSLCMFASLFEAESQTALHAIAFFLAVASDWRHVLPNVKANVKH